MIHSIFNYSSLINLILQKKLHYTGKKYLLYRESSIQKKTTECRMGNYQKSFFLLKSIFFLQLKVDLTKLHVIKI